MKNYIEKVFKDFKPKESLFFVFAVILVVIFSIYMNDSFISLVSAISGITYTIFAGKGRVICYYIGMAGTICYCILAYQNGFWGNLILYGMYYFPMEIIGIFSWKKHLKKNGVEIIKTKLAKKEKILLYFLAIASSFIMACFLLYNNDRSPYFDAITTVFSILGQYLTVKRCYEQWHIWFIVNILSFIMWFQAWLNGNGCFATVMMWGIYIILNLYFMKIWKIELQNHKVCPRTIQKM